MPSKPESIVDTFAQVVPPESARLNLGKREQVFSIAGADHRNVCKFARANDAQFLQLAGALEDLAEAALDRQQQKLLIPFSASVICLAMIRITA